MKKESDMTDLDDKAWDESVHTSEELTNLDDFVDELVDEGELDQNVFDSADSYVEPVAAAPRKSQTQIAREVWAGKWGVHEDREMRLSEAGYNFEVIQALVNKGVGIAGAEEDPNRR